MLSPYLIISPVRNEERFIKHTIESVVAQTAIPLEWIIVNDGSSDRTRELVKTYQRDIRWIKLVDRPDQGYRPGIGVVEAFRAGFEAIEDTSWEYIVKLDAGGTIQWSRISSHDPEQSRFHHQYPAG